MSNGPAATPDETAAGACWSCHRPLPAPTPACSSCGARLLVGDQFRIVRELGHGGMGVVYEALDLGLGRPVALKLMHPRLGADPAQRARFETECRAMAALDHPAIARIHSIGRHRDQVFIVQELIRGRSLGAWIREGGIDRPTALAITRALLGGIAHAHGHGIVHRDVNPNNVLVVGAPPDLAPKIVDFGMARLDEGEVATQAAWGGTSGFAAPEQILEASNNDRRSDLYAVGAVLFTMLSGGRTAWGDTFSKENVTTPAALVGAYTKLARGELGALDTDKLLTRDPSLEAWLRRALCAHPDLRFQEAIAMRDALDAVVAQTPWTAPSASIGAAAHPAPGSAPSTVVLGADTSPVSSAAHTPPESSPGSTLAGGWTGTSRRVANVAPPPAAPLSSQGRKVTIAATVLTAVAGAGVLGTWIVRGERARSSPSVATAAASSTAPRSTPAPVARPGLPLDVPVAVVALAQGGVAVADAGLHRVVGIDEAGNVRVIAGGTEPGLMDGPAESARFSTPVALAQAADGAILVADLGNRRLRSIRDGVVRTLAGDGVDECVDGSLDAARFRSPVDVVVTPSGDVVVADADAHAIRVLSRGTVHSIGGPTAGRIDGPLGVARFSRPSRLAVLPDGSIAIDDVGNGAVRVLRGDRVETRSSPSLPASAPSRPPLPHFLRALDQVVFRRGFAAMGETLLVTDPAGASIHRWTGPADAAWVGDGRPELEDGPASRARVSWPLDLDVRGDVAWFVDPLDRAVRRVEKGSVKTIARAAEGAFADGPGDDARFRWPRGVAIAPDGSIAIADPGNARVRRIDARSHVTTIAGSGDVGTVDGDAADASFVLPSAVAFAPDGTLVVGDRGARRIRAIRDGKVTTLAGSGAAGHVDGPAPSATFDSPEGVAVGSDGTIFVADAEAHAIRAIANGRVTTLAGRGQAGFEDGAALEASFASPSAIAIGPDGTIFVADAGNGAVRAIHGGRVRTVAGDGRLGFIDGPASEARFDEPNAIAVAPDGAIFVADEGSHRVRKIVEGRVSTVIGSGLFGFHPGPAAEASLARPAGVAVDATGKVWITDATAQRIGVLDAGVFRQIAGGP